MSEKDEAAVSSTPNRNESTNDKSDKMNEQSPMPEGPTDSHVLAQVEQDEKGLSQKTDSTEVTDIGWSTPVDHIEEPIIAGLSNDDLWMLIRRFDQASSSKKHSDGGFFKLTVCSKSTMSKPCRMLLCRSLI
jgi:hypothetical protein